MYVNHDPDIDKALKKLGQDFPHLNWDFSPVPGSSDFISHWLGDESEEVMVNVFHGKRINEQFHRHDFFFIHFAYRGDYDAFSAKYNNRITIKEGSCYIGQPYSEYAAKRESDEECIIIGVLIKIETFIREFLSSLSADTDMLRFFLDPQKNLYSDEFIHLDIPETSPIWKLLSLMALEYANKTEDSQKILKPMYMSLAMYLSAEYKRQNLPVGNTFSDKLIGYIETNADIVTLKSMAAHFGYHPVYLSRLLPEKTGKTFSELQLEARMHRAELLLKHTDFSIETIAAMLGYSNNSNFYKAFREYYGVSPRNLNTKRF